MISGVNKPVRAVVVAVVRWSLLAVGIALTTLSFVHLVDVKNEAARAAPWWWVGLIGVAATLLALGVPWSSRSRQDDGSRRVGS